MQSEYQGDDELPSFMKINHCPPVLSILYQLLQYHDLTIKHFLQSRILDDLKGSQVPRAVIANLFVKACQNSVCACTCAIVRAHTRNSMCPTYLRMGAQPSHMEGGERTFCPPLAPEAFLKLGEMKNGPNWREVQKLFVSGF